MPLVAVPLSVLDLDQHLDILYQVDAIVVLYVEYQDSMMSQMQ